MEAEARFSAPWSRLTRVATLGSLTAMLLLPLMLQGVEAPPAVSAVILLLTLLLALFCYALSPKAYVVTREGVEIVRPWSPFTIPAQDIKDIRPLTRDDMGITMRVFGSGGLFGFYGWFYSRKLRWMRWYSSRNTDLIGIETAALGWVVLSPDQASRFIGAVREKLGR